MRSFSILLALLFAAQVSAKTEPASAPKPKAHNADKTEETEVKPEEKSSCETPAENKDAASQ